MELSRRLNRGLMKRTTHLQDQPLLLTLLGLLFAPASQQNFEQDEGDSRPDHLGAEVLKESIQSAECGVYRGQPLPTRGITYGS